MSTLTPERSLEQRMNALEHANDIRSNRAVLKRKIKTGDESVPSVIVAPPEWALTMKVWDLALCQRKFGPVKVAKLFKQLNMSPSKTVGGLSARQRVELIDWFEARA